MTNLLVFKLTVRVCFIGFGHYVMLNLFVELTKWT